MPWLGFLLIAAFWILYFPKGEEVLLFNRHYHEPFNRIFKNLTHLGDGLAVLPLAALAAIGGYKRSLAVIVAGFGSGLLAQFFKKIVFPNHLRPAGYFSEGTLQSLDGVTQHLHFSFPSGHSTTAFALATLFVLWLPKRWAFPIFILALATGFSRIYLAQHFIEDVMAGSILGTTCAAIVYGLFQKHFEHSTTSSKN